MKKRFKNILTKLPKINGVFLCICTICITLLSGMLTGCSAINNDLPEEPEQTDLDNTGLEDHSNTQADSQDDSGTDRSNDAQNENMEDPSEQPPELEENHYKSILLGKSNFIHTGGIANESLNISEINQVVSDDDSVTARAIKFAVVDLDGDEEEEVVLWIQTDGHLDWGFEILHDQDGEIYGYALWYRAFMDLKTDGTFSTSHSAADMGMGRITFSEIGYSISEAYTFTTYNNNDEPIVAYFVDNEPCSMDEFYDAIEGQNQKADVEWYDFTENNINAVL